MRHILWESTAIEEQKKTTSHNEETGKESKDEKNTHELPHSNNIQLAVVQKSNFIFVHTKSNLLFLQI